MKEIIIGLVIVASLATVARAQSYGNSSYSIEPWNEDFSALSDPANRTDFFDPIKFIPLGLDRQTYLSLGGEVRDRFDYFSNPLLGNGGPANGFNLVRVQADADLHVGPYFRTFVQLDTSVESDKFGGPRPGDVDDVDFQQLFFDATLPIADSSNLTVRIGRQELIYGAQRLISPNDWRNVRQTFDGAKASIFLPNDTLDLFVVRPVQINQDHLNGDDDRTYFSGIYNVAELPGVLPGAHAKLDAYLLELDQMQGASNAVSANTYTLGARINATPGDWDFDFEPDLQFGDRASTQISAWAIALVGGFTFNNLIFAPRLGLGVDVASGSRSPAGRFNQLFGPQYIYLGHMYLIGRQNVVDLHPSFSLALTRDLSLSFEQHVFWRENTGDAVYNLTGGVMASDAASHAPYVGTESDLVANWQVQRHLVLTAGYSHFFEGDFLRAAGRVKNEDFVFGMATFTF